MSNLKNHLFGQTSPYLLQHSENPVDWYPWCAEAFDKAKKEDKPVFLSIGYSTCHWCHVMAHESFENEGVAKILNKHFVAIKVDKEERPDIDNIYMSVCQSLTGSGGWPMSIFMTPDQKPFFAGTYFPKMSRGGLIGIKELLSIINAKWQGDRQELIKSADNIITHMNQAKSGGATIDPSLIDNAINQFKDSFDRENGGFGYSPKFPAPHNLLLLMDYYEKNNDIETLKMVETTLKQMYRGGLFDHIGYGFSRYSTDSRFLVPHFEKMLYDNAMLIMSYAKVYDLTGNRFYIDVAEKVADYIFREMTGPSGEFYCAQDADSEGVEGRYYVFEPNEIVSVLGNEQGKLFNDAYDITEKGNFQGKSIPNLLKNNSIDKSFTECLPKLREYRQKRASLHLDDKVLTSWNSLMIAALAILYRVSDNDLYLSAAKKADAYITENLSDNNKLYVSFRDGKIGSPGFLDDYAFYIFALLSLYEATFDNCYLEKARDICDQVIDDFYDTQNGGFAFSGKENEKLIFESKETYDGAIPSGNSVMTYNAVKLFSLTDDERYGDMAEKQLAYMSEDAKRYPMGYSFYLLALSMYINPPTRITIVLKNNSDLNNLKNKFRLGDDLTVLRMPMDNYTLLNNKTTFYICKNHSCLPPTNEIPKRKNRLL